MSPPAPIRRIWLAVAVMLLVVAAGALRQLATEGQSPARIVKTWVWKADFWLCPVDEDAKQLASLHRDAKRGSREQCVACHEDKSNSMLVIHRIHLRSELLAGLECHDCHRHVDLTARDNKAVVTWVDVGFCKKCHSVFPGLKSGSHMGPDYVERDCTSCHRGEEAPRHEQPYLPKVIASTECKGCHGGRALPSTVRHERSDWLKTHGTEALDRGADSCYSCHDFGLKFCDQCHEEKPPTHLPAERWRSVHSSAARADTRACYACHKTSFCKTCHLNHEEGWLQRHPSFVLEEGDESCTECHSESACGYCHTMMSESAEATAAQ